VNDEKLRATIAENRRKAVEWLRTTKRKQGNGALYHSPTRRYCALGHMGLAVGIDAKGGYESDATDPYALIEHALGMNNELEQAIFNLNDDEGVSLREIGDYVANVWGVS
jgi:hypothetical protein